MLALLPHVAPAGVHWLVPLGDLGPRARTAQFTVIRYSTSKAWLAVAGLPLSIKFYTRFGEAW